MTNIVDGNLEVRGHIASVTMSIPSSSVVNASVHPTAAIDRSKLAQDALKPYSVPLTSLVVHDAPQTKLPTSAADDDLAMIAGTFGTDGITVQSSDSKAADTTQYARFFIPLPAEYDAAQTVTLRISAAMLTTVADVSAVIDVEAFEPDREGGVGSDICGTAFQDMNDLAFADYDFELVNTNLVAGDMLDIRIAVTISDSSTGTAVIACIGAIELLCDVKG